MDEWSNIFKCGLVNNNHFGIKSNKIKQQTDNSYDLYNYKENIIQTFNLNVNYLFHGSGAKRKVKNTMDKDNIKPDSLNVINNVGNITPVKSRIIIKPKRSLNKNIVKKIKFNKEGTAIEQYVISDTSNIFGQDINYPHKINKITSILFDEKFDKIKELNNMYSIIIDDDIYEANIIVDY